MSGKLVKRKRVENIPASMPWVSASDQKAVADSVATGWISSHGPALQAFEKNWAAYCGRRFGVAVSSGTAALDVAMAALKLGPGDEVILPSFTIISCVLSIIRQGAVPVLVDADPKTWGIDVARIKEKITPRTRVILAVHLYGHPANMSVIDELARRRKIAVIEDAAEAHGASARGEDGCWRRCGGFGVLGCFSFFANKIITTGEGGMLVTDDKELAVRCRSLRNLCYDAERTYRHDECGFTYRMTNQQAALGLSQFRRIDRILELRKRAAREYDRGLKGVLGLSLRPVYAWARPVNWMYPVMLSGDAGIDAAELRRRLDQRGVASRSFFLGMHEQPALQKRGLFKGESYPVTERLSKMGLLLPSATMLTSKQVVRVCAAVRDSLS